MLRAPKRPISTGDRIPITPDNPVDQLVELIRRAARTGQENAGGIRVVDLGRGVPIGFSRGINKNA